MAQHESKFNEHNRRGDEEFNRWTHVWLFIGTMMIISSCVFMTWAGYTLINWIVLK